MATVYLLDSVKVATPTTGTGSVTVGAAEPGYLTPAEAGAVDGRVYTWRLDDGDDFEIFVGTYSSTGPTVSRDTVLVSKISGTAGTSKINLSGTAKLSAVPVADYVVTPRQIREKLTANRTYYVRTDGNDNNTGLTDSPGGAFKTIQRAVDAAYALDLNGYAVTIQVGAGTFTGQVSVSGGMVGHRGGVVPLTIRGDTTTPANCVWSVTGNNCLSVTQGAVVHVEGFKFSTATSGDCLIASQGGIITVGKVEYGACAAFHKEATAGGHIRSVGNYTISGGAVAHEHCTSGSYILNLSIEITLTGTPNFSGFYVGVNAAYVEYAGVTFSGSATGKRFLVHQGGAIQSNGLGVAGLPGNVYGELYGGGWYDDITSSATLENNTTPGNSSLAMQFLWAGAPTLWAMKFYQTHTGSSIVYDVYTHNNSTTGTHAQRWDSDGSIFFPAVGTTASGANAVLDTGSSPSRKLLVSSSSIRYKTDVEPLDTEIAARVVRDARPVWYRSTAPADRKDWSWYGLIAEEVAEIDPRLVRWTYRDSDYEETIEGGVVRRILKPDAQLVPDGVQYDRLAVLLLAHVQVLEKRLAALEAAGSR